MSTSRKHVFLFFLIAGALVVVVVCGLMGVMVIRHKRQTGLFKDGELAFHNGDYEQAETLLTQYLSHDSDKEEAWKYLAQIHEAKAQWLEAAGCWQRLVQLNVLQSDYVTNCVRANYRIHNYQALNHIFNKAIDAQKEFPEIYALTRFKMDPADASVQVLLDALPADSATRRLVEALKNEGPASELEFLKGQDDPVLQVEACILDGYIAELREKDMARAEQCFRQAVDINPPLCERELGNFLFRQMRYPEAAEAYQRAYPAMLSGDAVLNYGEVLFFQKDKEGLQKLEKDVSRGVGDSLPVRAYVQCLLAAMERKTEDMVKNYQVAGLHRGTPMGLLISYLVAVETTDIPQMLAVLHRWRGTPVFDEKKEDILTSVRHVLMQAMEKRKWQEAASLAMLFREQKPPEILVYKALLLERASFGVVPEDILQEAITYFPDDLTFRALALRGALAKGNVEDVTAAYEQVIAKSAEPELDRYRKAIFLEQKGLVEEAFAEISKNMQEHPSEREAKHCLAFGMRTGHKPALEAVASYPQLAPIARFETERRYGEPEAALKMLTEQPLEQGLSAEVLEEREILLPLGLYLGISRQRERAIAVYEALKPYMKSSPIIDLNLSEIYKSLDDKEKAMANAADAYAKAPNNPLVRTVYGMRCAESGDFEKAVTLIPANTQDPEYQKVLVTCLEKCIESSYQDQRLASCRAYIRSLQELQPENACAADYHKRLEEADEQNHAQ